MQVDIVKTGGKWAVYLRSAFEYDEYKGDPIFTGDEQFPRHDPLLQWHGCSEKWHCKAGTKVRRIHHGLAVK